MHVLSWFAPRRFISLTRREYDWVFTFEHDTGIVVACLWRLIEDGRIRVTNEDDGHQFGLPAPLHAAVDVNQRIAGAVMDHVNLRDGTLDLDLRFPGRRTLQIIPNSSGYEAWSVHCPTGEFIAVGGGDVAVFGRAPSPSRESESDPPPRG